MMGKEAESEIGSLFLIILLNSRHVDDMSHDTEDVFSEILKKY
jgi:hypothetical protein